MNNIKTRVTKHKPIAQVAAPINRVLTPTEPSNVKLGVRRMTFIPLERRTIQLARISSHFWRVIEMVGFDWYSGKLYGNWTEAYRNYLKRCRHCTK